MILSKLRYKYVYNLHNAANIGSCQISSKSEILTVIHYGNIELWIRTFSSGSPADSCIGVIYKGGYIEHNWEKYIEKKI